MKIKTGLDNAGNQCHENIKIYLNVPSGWIKTNQKTLINGKTFEWIHENKSLFSKEKRNSGLLKI